MVGDDGRHKAIMQMRLDLTGSVKMSKRVLQLDELDEKKWS